jgi:glycosyltransferase involved in cell wall biosynthesis
VFEIPYWVARAPFGVAGVGETRELAVCYMPRKLPEQVSSIKALVAATHGEVPWVQIDNLPEGEVAQRFRANSVFLSTQYLEGFGLPALEAMACGCLVAGYKGTAGFAHPYASTANGVWAPDEDTRAAAAAVTRAIEIVREAGPTYRAYLEAGRETAKRFTRETALPAVAAMVEAVRTKRYDAPEGTARGLGWRESMFVYKLLYDYDRLGWSGRVLSSVSRATKPLRRVLGLVRR